MNTTRCLLISLLVVLLLVSTFVAPLSVSAAQPDRFQVQFMVSEGEAATIDAGPVRLVIPAEAMPRSGPVVVKVTVDGNVVTADFHPKYEFSAKAYVGFQGDLQGAMQVTKGGNDLEPLTEAYTADGYTFYEIDHFSRYSGWF